jgi:hypothetical protein
MNENEFIIGDVVYLKSDLARKSPMVVGYVSIYTPQPFYNHFTGETEPPDETDPYLLIHCTWFNSQRKLEQKSFRADLLTK